MKPVLVFVALLGLAVAFPARAEEQPAFRAGTASAPAPAMGLGHAVVLGAVEGITEFLPVSSTGHLLIIERLFGMWKNPGEKAASDAYAIVIQLGAILAVFIISFGRIRAMVAGIFGRSAEGLRLLGKLVAAFIPAAVLGLLLENRIKQYLYGIWPVAAAWLVGGVFILLVLRKRGSEGGLPLEGLTWQMAVIIGFAQCFALWPGVSRSLATMAGGILLGLSVPAAVEFSFLLGLVTLGVATIYEGIRVGPEIVRVFGWVNPIVGLIVAAVTAFIAIRWMISYLTKRSPVLFGWYRIGAAVVAAAIVFSGL